MQKLFPHESVMNQISRFAQTSSNTSREFKPGEIRKLEELEPHHHDVRAFSDWENKSSVILRGKNGSWEMSKKHRVGAYASAGICLVCEKKGPAILHTQYINRTSIGVHQSPYSTEKDAQQNPILYWNQVGRFSNNSLHDETILSGPCASSLPRPGDKIRPLSKKKARVETTPAPFLAHVQPPPNESQSGKKTTPACNQKRASIPMLTSRDTPSTET